MESYSRFDCSDGTEMFPDGMLDSKARKGGRLGLYTFNVMVTYACNLCIFYLLVYIYTHNGVYRRKL